jgi:hypothetical protein
VVVDGATGFVVETVEQMAGAVALIAQISRAACRTRVESHYSDSAVTDVHYGVYCEVIARVRGEAGAIPARSAAAR